MRTFRPLVVSVVLLAGAASTVSAGLADLDRTFGNGGSVIVPFTAVDSVAEAVVVQPDGKIVAAGVAGSNFALARLHPDGNLDTSFGVGGRVVTDFGGFEEATALVLQPDGKLVVAGTTLSATAFSGNTIALALARYQSDGSLDRNFGVGGLVRTPELNAVRALVLQPDGMLVVGGAGASHFMLARYDAAGGLDPTFGAGGVASTNFPDSGVSWLLLYAIVLQADGKIVAVGGGGSLIALARFAADGTLDATFGTGGRATTDVSFTNTNPGIRYPLSRAYRVSVLADGKLALAGVSETAVESGVYGVPFAPGTALALRYNSDGTIDTRFNSTGIVVLNNPAQQLADARGLIVEPDGGLVAIGWGYFRKRIRSDGTIDPSFASDDVPSGGAIDLVAQSDGRLVAAGYAVTGPDPTFEIVRFGGDCGNGVLDPGEECDDGNAVSGDGCDLNCTVTRCGNGIVTAGENCEPGASTACCTPSCTFASAGTPCVIYEGLLCGTPQCNATGACVDPQVPSPMCVAPSAGASTLSLSKLSDAGRRVVSWTWKRRPVDAADFEDPSATLYALCIYDHSGGAAQLAAHVPIVNPKAWRSSAEGYRYHQRTRESGSVRVLLRANRTGVGALHVNASAEFVAPTSALPMSVDPKVTAQLRNVAGGCWGADYVTPARNDSERFTAKSD